MSETFKQHQTYTLGGGTVYEASKCENVWYLWDVNKSYAWQVRPGRFSGYVEGYMQISPGNPFHYFRFDIDFLGRLTWTKGPTPVDGLLAEHFIPCDIRLEKTKREL